MSGSLGQALIIALVAGILEWDIYGWGHTMISRPLVAGPVIGLILGDMKTGLIIGGSIEMIYLGVLPIGAAVPPDATTATTIATSLAILSGIGKEMAVTLAVPVAMAAQMLQMFIWTINTGLMHRADKYAEVGDLKGTDKLHLLGSFLFFLQGFLPVFFAVLFGVDAVKAVVDSIPDWLTNWLNVAGGMLPALGFAMLYTMMSSKRLLPFFIIGFGIASYFNASLMAVAVIGLGVALLYVNIFSSGDKVDKGGVKND